MWLYNIKNKAIRRFETHFSARTSSLMSVCRMHDSEVTTATAQFGCHRAMHDRLSYSTCSLSQNCCGIFLCVCYRCPFS